MRALVISDIHANLPALETVLQEAGKVNAVWCLGDVVGYGPHPNECLDLLREQPNLTCLLGNHDAAAIGKMSVVTFNHEARIAVEWTQSVLTNENIEFLKERPQLATIDQVTLAHGSPRQPIFEYILDIQAATDNFDYFDTDYCFIGHSHLPLMFQKNSRDYRCKLSVPSANKTSHLKPRTIINPGSLGQPRDRDARASFAIFDTGALTWEYCRVPYDFKITQESMRQCQLPERHIARLAGGW